MKRIILALIAVFMIAVFGVPAIKSHAVSGAASLAGPGTVRAGDTITVKLNINGSNILGVSGTISYNGGQVQLVSTKQNIGGGWAVEFNGTSFVAYDNNLTSPINGGSTLFTATFRVGSVPAGSTINISCSGTISDGSTESGIRASYSASVAAPLSTNNNLASLSVSNATISPSFSPSKTQYKADVPYEVSKLQVSASAEDPKAKVSVNSPNLAVNGNTNVSVTVTAENGAKKTYTITVHRAQDPNYVPSGNNSLGGITVEGFLLSPGFTTENTRYVVWVPYETTNINIYGSASDPKASVSTAGGTELLAGQDNEVKVICTAENGETREYIVVVKRAPSHDGQVDEIEKEDEVVKEEVKVEKTQSKITICWLVAIGLLGIILGFVAGVFLKDKLPKIHLKKKEN